MSSPGPPGLAGTTTLERRALAFALGGVLATGMALGGWWAARVPIFGAPDEDVHFDYVAHLLTAGRPILASERPVPEIGGSDPFVPCTHPWTLHLRGAGATKETRFHPERAVPAGYGSRDWFAAVDRTAPSVSRPPARNPWSVTEYPVGYYALAAVWAAAWSHVFPGLVGTFFSVRALSVVLLGVGAFGWWLVLRRIRVPPWRALGILAVTCWLPLTSFVSSAVQPDNLSFAAVPWCLWLAMRAAALSPSARRLAAAGAGLAGILLVKYHVFLAVALAVSFLLAEAHSRWRPRRWVAWGLLLLGPLLLAAEAQLWISSGGGSALRNLTASALRADLLAQAGSRAGYAVRVFRSMLWNFFSTRGVTFQTLWSYFGWVDTRVVIVSEAVHEVVLLGLQAGMVVMLALLAMRWQQALTTCWRAWSKGRPRRAIRLLARNPVFNANLFFAGLLSALFLVTNNGFAAQGRHWFAFLPAILWATVEQAPRALASPRAARALRRCVLGVLVAYAVVAAWSAPRSIEWRYYRAGRPVVAYDPPLETAPGP